VPPSGPVLGGIVLIVLGYVALTELGKPVFAKLRSAPS
jgi:hypothetical protein